MDIIRTLLVHYGKDGAMHTHKIDALVKKEKFSNANKVKWAGVNGVSAVVDDPDHPTKYTIIQAGGWNARRGGLFVDSYEEE